MTLPSEKAGEDFDALRAVRGDMWCLFFHTLSMLQILLLKIGVVVGVRFIWETDLDIYRGKKKDLLNISTFNIF